MTTELITPEYAEKLQTKTKAYIKQELRKYLTKDEVNSYLLAMPAGKNKMIVQVLWMTGMRVTELISLHKGDIDFINSRMVIRWLKSRKMQQRVIPMHPQLRDILQFYTAKMNDPDRVFPYTRQWIGKITKSYLKVSPHTLRHSFSVNFLNQSKSPIALVVLKNLLGHSHIGTTMEYLRIVPNDMAIELEKVGF